MDVRAMTKQMVKVFQEDDSGPYDGWESVDRAYQRLTGDSLRLSDEVYRQDCGDCDYVLMKNGWVVYVSGMRDCSIYKPSN